MNRPLQPLWVDGSIPTLVEVTIKPTGEWLAGLKQSIKDVVKNRTFFFTVFRQSVIPFCPSHQILLRY